MTARPRVLTAGCVPLDRVRPLMDERVGVPAYALAFPRLTPREIIDASLRRSELAIAQVSPCHFLRYLDEGGEDYVGLPIPLGRSFRHDAIYVRQDEPWRHPRDINNRVVGCPDLLATTHIWQKGMMQDHYGVELASLSWRVGKVDLDLTSWSMPPKAMLTDGSAQIIDGTDTLSEQLLRGEIDMLLTYKRPRAFVEGLGIRRLFTDPRSEAMKLWSRSGVWPITQMVIMRRDLAEADPELPATLTTAFTASKNVAIEELRETSYSYATLPYLSEAVELAEQVFGQDFWPYGMDTCSRTMLPFARYCHEQGLTSRVIQEADIFPHFAA